MAGQIGESMPMGPSMPMPSMPFAGPPGTSAAIGASMPMGATMPMGTSAAFGQSMPMGGGSMPFGASMPMGGGSMPMGGGSMPYGASMPMGTSAGLQGTQPFSVQPGMAGVGSATYGDFPGPAAGPMPSMPMPMPGPMPAAGGMPMHTSASIPPMGAPPSMGPPMSMAPQPMPTPAPMSAPAPGVQQQWIPGPYRPAMTSVAAPPVVGGAPQNPIQYGPSYNMSYHVRSTADKTAVKYTGFLPMEGVFEEDTCRIG